MARDSIPAAVDMPWDLFHKHMNKRHVELDDMFPFTTRSYEEGSHAVCVAFHDRNHKLEPDKYDHDHLEES